MPTLTGTFDSISNVGAWTSSAYLNDDDTNAARKYQPPTSSSYVQVYNWEHRNSIHDDATINSILVNIRGYIDTSATYTTGCTWGFNLLNTDLTANRKYSNSINEGSQTTLYIPTSGTGNAESWWVSGWTDADFIAAVKGGDRFRLYAQNNTSDYEWFNCEYVSMTVDFDNPPTKGGILLGSFG